MNKNIPDIPNDRELRRKAAQAFVKYNQMLVDKDYEYEKYLDDLDQEYWDNKQRRMEDK